MALTIFELLASLGGLCVLSLLTVLARYSLIFTYRSICSVKRGLENHSNPSFIESKYGHIGVAVALLGLYITNHFAMLLDFLQGFHPQRSRYG